MNFIPIISISSTNITLENISLKKFIPKIMSILDKTKGKVFILDRIAEIEENIISIIGKETVGTIQAEKRGILNNEIKNDFQNCELKHPTIISKDILE